MYFTQSIAMKNYSLNFISLLAVASLILISACSETPEKDWAQKTRDVFGNTTDSKHLILLIRVDQRGEMSRYSPMLVVPAGNGFDNFAPLAFLPDDDEPQAGNNENEQDNGNGGEQPDDGVEPENDQGGNDGEDGENNNGENNEATESPFEGWPEPTGPKPEDEDNEGEDEDDDQINEELDDALRRAYQDEEPDEIENEDENENRFRFRLWTPRFPVPDRKWWDSETDLPDLDLPDFDFELPRWKDLEDDQERPPFWLPPGETWPPRDYDLPDEWKPSDNGFKLGEWRVYIQPLPED